mgnify:FL=1
MKTKKIIPTQVKNQNLVNTRRQQIIDAAVQLFTQKGFHKTTTRQIARKSGFSIGTLYEYIQTKEDVLYLVCDHIHSRVEEGVKNAIKETGNGLESLKEAIREYFMICDSMSDEILLIYQESKSLNPESMKYVLHRDIEISLLFEDIIRRGVADGSIKRGEKSNTLLAHNIVVLGHMWTFRGWFLTKNYSINEYTEQQLQLLLN